MKKLLIITLAVLFAAGAAYAVEYDYSGMINTRGSYIDNWSGEFDKDEAGDYMYYDMEFDSTLVIRPTDKSSIHLNWEIHDESWLDTAGDSNSYGSDTDADDQIDSLQGADDNIVFKRAFGSVKFDMGGTLDFGLMTGGAWATAFGDNANGEYRLKWRQDTAMGPVFVILQKNAELGESATKDYDAEKDDQDVYYLAMVTKVGDISIKPLLGYGLIGQLEADEEEDVTLIAALLGVDGSFGAIGFEAEFIYKDYSYDLDKAAAAEDYSIWGAYANVWTTMDAVKVGGMVAYGSYDKDGGTAAGYGKGFGFGEDFGPGYWVMDWEHFGSGGKYEYYAATLLAVYADFAVNDDLSLYGCLEYMMSNEEDTYYEDATGTIVNFGLGYSLADNVQYSIGAAYGQFDSDDTDVWDPEPFTRIYHKIQVNF